MYFLSFLLATTTLASSFTSVLVDNTHAEDAQFVMTDAFDGGEYSIISATQSGNLTWHIPGDSLADKWSSYVIGFVPGAQHGESIDINSDGFPDLVVSYKYGKCPTECKSSDGLLAWFENPKEFGKPWKFHYIGKPAFAAHRVVVVNKEFDRAFIRLISIPISGVSVDNFDPFLSPMSISAYSLPSLDGLDLLSGWEEYESVVAEDLNLCHEGKPWYHQNSTGLALACLQGGIYMELDLNNNDTWIRHDLIEPMSFDGVAFDHEKMYPGISSLAQGAIIKEGKLTEIVPFIAPFHDGHIGVLIDGNVTMIDQIPGVGHEIRVAKTYGINDDIVVGFRQNHTGLFVYSYNDSTGEWDKQIISDDAVNFMSVVDFNNDGLDDIATINFGKVKNNSDILLHLSLY